MKHSFSKTDGRLTAFIKLTLATTIVVIGSVYIQIWTFFCELLFKKRKNPNMSTLFITVHKISIF